MKTVYDVVASSYFMTAMSSEKMISTCDDRDED